MRSWPRARPVTHAVNVSCTTEALASNSCASSGNAGRYMSIDSGPIAITDPSTRTSPRVDEVRRGRRRGDAGSAIVTSPPAAGGASVRNDAAGTPQPARRGGDLVGAAGAAGRLVAHELLHRFGWGWPGSARVPWPAAQHRRGCARV